jgi:hypothetical protein
LRTKVIGFNSRTQGFAGDPKKSADVPTTGKEKMRKNRFC